MIEWALTTLKMAVHQNLEGARKHHETYGTHDIHNITTSLIKECCFIFTRMWSRNLIVWGCHGRAGKSRSEHRHGFWQSQGSIPRNLNSVIWSKGEMLTGAG